MNWSNDYPTLSRPVDGVRLRVLSLGVGVQSSTLALAAARGEVGPMPDVAIFADTGWEPAAVYSYLEYLRELVPYPIIVAQRAGPDLGEWAMRNAALPLKGRSSVPFYTADPVGMLAKQCSREFKTRVVTREVRRLLGLEPRQRVTGDLCEMWIGISTDEVVRMKPHEASYIVNRHPLIEANMSRQNCLTWLAERQYRRPPKSSCVFCPFRDNAAWVAMGRNEPEDFARAILVDDAIRPGFAGMEGSAYAHRNRIPLRDLDLSVDLGAGQIDFAFDDCNGGCGL